MPSFSYKKSNTLLWCFSSSSSLPAAVGFSLLLRGLSNRPRRNKETHPDIEIMGFQSSVRAKRLWNVLKVTLLLMARKKVISKRRFIMDMNFMVKRGKLFRKFISNYFMLHHHHSGGNDMTRGGFSIQDYEFSCSNTPINPVFSHMSKQHHTYSYFPCINLPVEIETKQQQENDFTLLHMEMTPENTLNQMQYYNALSPAMKGGSPLVSPFNVRISNYSSEEENEISSESGLVDNQAEEFIRRFYEQLKMQRRLQLLQHS